MRQLLAKFAVFCTVTMLCGSSLAQVVKCKDAKGKVVYSDVACPTNFDASSVNLSGGNITESQVRAAQDRTASNSNVESCGMLKNLAQQTFASFVENPNANRWNTSFQSLQNLANMCPSTDVCGTLWRSPKLTHLCSQKSDPLPAHLFVLWRPDAQTFQ